MKILSTFFLLVVFCLAQQHAKAQLWMGLSGMQTRTLNTPNTDKGYGFGISFLSKGDTLGNKKDPKPVKVQYGGNFVWAGLGHKNFDGVPLLSPQNGSAQVKISNACWNVNAMARFSRPNKSSFTPYADLFLGYRNSYSILTVSPENVNRYTKTTQSLGTAYGINYGFGGGILMNSGNNAAFNIGFSYYRSRQDGGQVADLSSAYADASGINLNLMNAPGNILMINIGFEFCLDGKGISVWNNSDTSSPSYINCPVYNSSPNYTPRNVAIPFPGKGGYYPVNNSGYHPVNGTYHPSNGGYHPSGGGGYHPSGGGGGGGAHVGVHIGGGRAK